MSMMGAGLRPSRKLLDRPPDPAVTCAPHFYPDLWLKHRKPSLMTSKPEPSLCSGKSLADNLLTGHAASGVEEA